MKNDKKFAITTIGMYYECTDTISTTGTSVLRDTTNCSDDILKCVKAGKGHTKITYI